MFLGFSETEINGIDALKMAKCYMDAFYQKPPSIPRNDIVAMEETLNPHLAFSEQIDNCLKGIDAIVIWRKTLSTFSMPLRSAYLTFGGYLIRKLIIKISDEELKTTLNGMLQRIKIEIESNFPNVAYSFLRKKFDPKAFSEANKKLESSLESVNVNGELGEDYQEYSPQFPKVLKVISVVRHGERLDNDNEEKKKALEREEQCYYSEDCNRKFGLDNSPLNEIGIKRATILKKVFDNINIQHIFSSPYERALQTALLLLGESHKNFDSEGKLENELKIKVEPGFIENMIDCVNKPIGYEDIEELAKHHSRLDTAYVPILNREKLAEDYKGDESRRSDIGCNNRLEYVLNQLLYNVEKQCLKDPFFNKSLVDQGKEGKDQNEWMQPGEETAEQIVIVAHGLMINAFQNHISGMFTYAAQVC
uniref:Uncharacterized protein n=1 Tax=Meloidogyne javanica TaxID=6303 RepID=A0A915LKW7_MELJA